MGRQLNLAEQLTLNQRARGSSPLRLTLQRQLHPPEGVAMVQEKRTVSAVKWALAPDWLTVEGACFLSGWDANSMLEIIDAGGVDLNREGLIEKQSLGEFQEACVLVAHSYD